MKVSITKDVYRHHTNENFKCVVVKFEPTDAFYENRMDWLPRFEEIQEIIRNFAKLDREYIGILIHLLKEISNELDTQIDLKQFFKR
jgi:hypothetical protein